MSDSDRAAQPDHQPGSESLGQTPVRRLTVVIGGLSQFIYDEFPADEDILAELRRSLAETDDPGLVVIHDLLSWPEGTRRRLLKLMATLGSRFRFRLDGQEQLYANPFEAVLAALVGHDDVVRGENGRRAAIEAASLFHPDALSIACSHIAKRLQDLGVKNVRIQDVLKQAESLRVAEREQREQPAITVRDILPDAPVPSNVIVPPGWRLSASAVIGVDKEPDISIPAPVIISACLSDSADHTETLRLAWKRDGNWRDHLVKRGTAFDSRKVIELAEVGFPVTSNNARAVVEYLLDFETANRPHLPREFVSRRMGWQGSDLSHGFLWGRTLIAEANPNNEADSTENAQPVRISFRGADSGDEQLADGFRARGTFEEWRNVVAPLMSYPKVQIAIFTALVPPLLPILSGSNFVLDYCGETTNGKTTTQRLAASVWGNPDERSPSATLSTWDATRVWIERASATLNNLPIILDDTKRARSKQDIAQTLYDVTSGRGRGRGTILGTQQLGTWNTVLITSGEAPVTSFSEDGGTRARVLTLWGSPFGSRDPATAKTVQGLDSGIRAHFGHSGPLFVRYLLQHRKDWPGWREEYNARQNEFQERAQGNVILGRMAGHLATLAVCSRLALTALQLPWSFCMPVNHIWEDLAREVSEADRASAALATVMSWAYSHQDEFFGRRDRPGLNRPEQPPTGWAGRWEWSLNGEWPYIGFLPSKLRNVLEAAGFEYESILRIWKERGWVLTDSEGKARVKARIGKEANPWMVAITREGVNELDKADVLKDDNFDDEPEMDPEEVKIILLDFWRPWLQRLGGGNAQGSSPGPSPEGSPPQSDSPADGR